MNQLERITRMEAILDRSEAALAALDRALEDWAAVREGLAELEAYYSGGQWRQDYDDDSAGKIPQGLKRGVLSEDAVYNLLWDRDKLLRRMKELGRD